MSKRVGYHSEITETSETAYSTPNGEGGGALAPALLASICQPPKQGNYAAASPNSPAPGTSTLDTWSALRRDHQPEPGRTARR